MEHKTNKVQFWNLPADWHPELSKGARKLYSRLMCLTSAGTKECTYITAQAMKELDASEKTARRYFAELTKSGLIETDRKSNSFGKGVRAISLVAEEAPESIQKQRGQTGQITGQMTGQMTGQVTNEMTSYDRSNDRSKKSTMTGHQSAKRLIYITVDKDPLSYIKENKELLKYIYAQALTFAPSLGSSLISFSLGGQKAALEKYLNAEFTPWGQPHDCNFDFTHLWDTYGANNIEALKDKEPRYWELTNPDNEQCWRDYFVMSILMELSCFSDQCFFLPEDCDPFGRNFFDYYYDYQYGLLHLIINNVYAADSDAYERGEPDGYLVYKSIRDSYRPGRGASLASFAKRGVINHVLDIINTPSGCETAYQVWRNVLTLQMRRSFPCDTIKNPIPKSRDYCRNYFDPDIARFLLCDERGLVPRFCMPYLLFRRVVCCHTASRIHEDGFSDLTTFRVVSFLEHLRDAEEPRRQWNDLCAFVGELFPFVNYPEVFDHV